MYKGAYGRIILEEKDIELIRSEYAKGLSQNAVADVIGVNHNLIRKAMKDHNIPVRTDREQALKYKSNEDFFEVIDTEAKAYWLGFIYADGYVTSKKKHQNRKLGITITKADVELLEKFKRDIQSNNPIKQYESTTGYENSKNYVRVIIASEKLTDDLIKLGVVENKTEKITFPTTEQVPSHLVRHFIRGYMDGDGSISRYKAKETFTVSFCGTKSFLESLQTHFNTSLKLDKRYDDSVDNYSLRIGGNRQVEQLLNYLYEDATVYLERKYKVYTLVMEQNQIRDSELLSVQ